jgi:hypothetical protein
MSAAGAEQESLLVRRDAGSRDVGLQRLGERVMARHHRLSRAGRISQPDPFDWRSSTRILIAAPPRAKP